MADNAPFVEKGLDIILEPCDLLPSRFRDFILGFGRRSPFDPPPDRVDLLPQKPYC